MTCANHPETPVVAYCRSCGKGLCAGCRQEWQGIVYCPTCIAAQQAASPPPYAARTVSPVGDVPSPGLAFVLGLIPGVGAIYNGQYGKGIVHVVVLGLLISIVSSDAAGDFQAMFGILIPVWFLYMALEAYHTAKKRLLGEQVDEFSGLLQVQRLRGRAPVGPIVLIVLGVVFLLNTLGYLHIERLVRFWPVLLIAAGIYMLYVRLAGRPEAPPSGGGGQELQ